MEIIHSPAAAGPISVGVSAFAALAADLEKLVHGMETDQEQGIILRPETAEHVHELLQLAQRLCAKAA